VMKSLLVLASALASAVALERLPAVSGRRSVLVGAVMAASPLKVASPAFANKPPSDLQDIKERAETGNLIVPTVLGRAKDNELVNPKQLEDCMQLTNVLAADQEALYELLPAARSYIRFQRMAFDDTMDATKEKQLDALLRDCDVEEKRLSRQVKLLADEKNRRKCKDPVEE